MNLNRKELRKIMNNFNSISNRLLQANYNDYTSTVKKYVSFIKDTPIIYEYILGCGKTDLDLPELFQEIQKSPKKNSFPIGESVAEEDRNIFAILNYIAENNIHVYGNVGMVYTSSTHFQDHIKAFNDRLVEILINHISTYLSNIGIDMGVDEKTTYSITVKNGQVNIANDDSTLVASNKVDAGGEELVKLIETVKSYENELADEDAEMLDGSLQMLQEEANSPKPRKGVFKTIISALKTIKAPAELAAAVLALIQYIQTMYLA